MSKALKHIALIDDGEEDNEFHALAIKKAGFNCTISVRTSAESGLAFIEEWINDLPDLIFLDAMMPRINGFEMVGKIDALLASKNVEVSSRPKIYLLSGSYNPEMDRVLQNKEYETLVKGYRIKPLTAAMLLDIVKTNF